jgi:hypothetical protein
MSEIAFNANDVIVSEFSACCSRALREPDMP